MTGGSMGGGAEEHHWRNRAWDVGHARCFPCTSTSTQCLFSHFSPFSLQPTSTCAQALLMQIFSAWIASGAVRLALNQIDYMFTSSIAQGGGGSFKNRKPIGEVGCCESRMAERTHTDGPKGGWSCVFGVVAMVAVVTSPTTAGCSVL